MTVGELIERLKLFPLDADVEAGEGDLVVYVGAEPTYIPFFERHWPPPGFDVAPPSPLIYPQLPPRRYYTPIFAYLVIALYVLLLLDVILFWHP